MSAVLEGLDEVLCHMDDVLIFGSNKEEHDLRLSATLQRLEQAGVTLNPSKCVFATDHIMFLIILLTRLGYKQTQPRHLPFFRWMLLSIYLT